MKKALNIVFFFLFIKLSLFAQTTFFKNYKRPSSEKVVYSAILENGKFILAGEMRLSGYDGVDQGYAIILSTNGEIEKEFIADSIDASRYEIVIPYKFDNADFLFIGSNDSVSGGDIYCRLVFHGLDNDLNVVDHKKYSFMKNNIVYPWQYVINNDSILYLTNSHALIYKGVNIGSNISVIKYQLPFDSLRSYYRNEYLHSQDLIFKEQKNELDVFVFPSKSILQFDSNLNYLTSKEYPGNFVTNISITPLDDTNYLITGAAYLPPPPFNAFRLGCMRFNNDDISLDSLFFTPNVDTNFYTGIKKNTIINGENIFISGFYNVDANTFPYSYTPSWITITKTDLNLNIISNHFYGGDAVYCPYTINATSDGGCFVTGYSYDYINNLPANNYELDIFALKVNSDGLITDLPDHPEAKAHSAIVYPNPGHDHLTIQSGPQINDAVFTLYDMQGRAVLSEKITSTQVRLNTSGLTPGTYPWQIVFKNKVIESGKWVKE